MNTLQTPVATSNDIPQRAPVSDDVRFSCVWASLGLVPFVGLIWRDTDADQHHDESQTC